jgi:putative ABC transport system permease protein
MFGADKDFLKTFEVTLLKGRNFEGPKDSVSIIVNEKAAAMLGIDEPAEQRVGIPAASEGGSYEPLNAMNISFRPRVIGIVKDFHFQSLRDKIEPLVLAYNKNPIHSIDYYSVRISGANIQTTLARLKEVMVNNDKNEPFEYHFLDKQLELFYVEDRRRQTILIWVALATVFIAGLGLFGLASFTTIQRTKEIGIRKVLGASVPRILKLLYQEFVILLVIANGIAFPITGGQQTITAGICISYQVEWWVFAIAGIFAIVTLATVGYQAIKAALSTRKLPEDRIII